MNRPIPLLKQELLLFVQVFAVCLVLIIALIGYSLFRQGWQDTVQLVVLEKKDLLEGLLFVPGLCVAGDLLGKAMDWLWDKVAKAMKRMRGIKKVED